MYQVIIVEDDSMVASINRRYVETVEEFEVTGSFRNGNDALEYLMDHKTDLVILDYYLPGMNGAEFLDRLREAGIRTEVLMVTGANSAEIVRELLRRGVRDYLVKPFEYDRFLAALQSFKSERELLGKDCGTLGQTELDRIFRQQEGGMRSAEDLPKGMNRNTMALVLGCRREHTDEHLTCEEISRHVGLSRITVRRYLNHLVESGRAESLVDYRTGGRPGVKYILAEK